MSRHFAYVLFVLVSFAGRSQNSPEYRQLLQLVEERNFFQARELFGQNKTQLTQTEQEVVQAFLLNAFNQPVASNDLINHMFEENETNLPDTLKMALLDVKQDNASKSFEYREAMEAVNRVVVDYPQHLSPEELGEYLNALKLWTILKDQPRQEVTVSGPEIIPMTKDKAGLWSLAIKGGGTETPFIFDTGANLSVVSQSTARNLGMQVLPDSIEVNTITGTKVHAQMAVCPELTLGNCRIRNAVFLVLSDADLSFPQANYEIHGILGFPVIAALGEIGLTQKGEFCIGRGPTSEDNKVPLALDQLTPLIELNGLHFHFDTGADQSMLYGRYYEEHKDKITRKHKETDLQFGGAGGVGTYRGYIINFDVRIGTQKVTLSSIPVLMKTPSEHKEFIYGNIGQDLIRQFDTMYLNFEKMYVAFE